MGIAHTVKISDYARADIGRLDQSQRIQIMKSIARIERDGMSAGEPLHGSLRGCRRMKHRKLGLRVVFRQSVGRIEIIEVVAVGKREADEVYSIAERRIQL